MVLIGVQLIDIVFVYKTWTPLQFGVSCPHHITCGKMASVSKAGGIKWIDLLVIGTYLGPLLLTWFNFNPSMDK